LTSLPGQSLFGLHGAGCGTAPGRLLPCALGDGMGKSRKRANWVGLTEGAFAPTGGGVILAGPSGAHA